MGESAPSGSSSSILVLGNVMNTAVTPWAVCGTAAEVIGLSEIDFRTIGDGKSGKVTREIQNVYHDLIRGKVAKYEHWCEYV